MIVGLHTKFVTDHREREMFLLKFKDTFEQNCGIRFGTMGMENKTALQR